MTGAAFVLGYLLAHPGWLVAYVCVSAVTTVALLYYTIDDGHGRHALTAEDAATIEWARELHHDERWWLEEKPGNAVPAFLPAATTEFAEPTLTIDPVRYAHNLRYRYSDELADELQATNVLGPEVGTADRAHGDPVTVAEDPAAAVAYPPPPLPVTRHPLPPVTGPALTVLAALTAPLRARAEQIKQAEAAAWQAEVLAAFPEWDRWPGDDTLTGMRAIKAGAS